MTGDPRFVTATRRPPRPPRERTVASIDLTVVKRALLGTPAALNHLERGLAIALNDGLGLEVEITARGLGVSHGAVNVATQRAREAAPAKVQAVLRVGAIQAAPEVIDAVQRRDAGLVEELLGDLDVPQLRALVVALAGMAGAPVEATA